MELNGVGRGRVGGGKRRGERGGRGGGRGYTDVGGRGNSVVEGGCCVVLY
jgi:hypothetical protein